MIITLLLLTEGLLSNGDNSSINFGEKLIEQTLLDFSRI